MAISKVDICNMALVGIGADTIQSLTEKSAERIACTSIYDATLDDVLTLADWYFAISQKELSESSEAPTWGYAYRYALPNNPYCLRVIRVEDVPIFRLAGRYIECDTGSTINIEYIGRITDPGEYSVYFQQALAARIGAEIAFRLTKSDKIRKSAWENFYGKLAEAKLRDARDGVTVLQDDSTWVTER